MVRAFKIYDKFVIEGKGVALTGAPFPEVDGFYLAEDVGVEVRSDGAPILRTKSRGFELLRNTWSPHKPRDMAVLISVADFRLPKDAELWVEEVGLLPLPSEPKA